MLRNIYTHGYHPSVLRSHSKRTVRNSAAFVLPFLKDGMRILDIGCGPGTITIDFARMLPQAQVIGIDMSKDVINIAEENARRAKIKNVQFEVGDIHTLQQPKNNFDMVFAHQVLQYVKDPVECLTLMKSFAKSESGFVAARESILAAFAWCPETANMSQWQRIYSAVAYANGGEPNAGKYLHRWARRAGFRPDKILKGSSTTLFCDEEDIKWWSSLWAERILKSRFYQTVLTNKIAKPEELKAISKGWIDWAASEDCWFLLVRGEIIAFNGE
ncbi:UbiE family methyltransferase [Schizosaccharomyces japonicus yFS275]|uniref:UbiE family methyltransferase n=1 Tax=Schizosaccharomyces japonicus (strain yFS275 / FY16936) TaxID=402676 RepID=B6K557_SCHJY|nr:UbiE family methyltransferase [Schizosaccharomyces japonicus yFS275]EEB08661.1 UbiE family methyltransferase [Schizosaccharomyces japonicus yFS275]